MKKYTLVLIILVTCSLQSMDNSALSNYLEMERILFDKMGGAKNVNAISRVVMERVLYKIDLNLPIKGYLFPIIFFCCGEDGRVTSTKKLLRNGANPNVTMYKDIRGIAPTVTITPLLDALDEGAVKTAKQLLKYGADPKYTYDGESILHHVSFFTIRESTLKKDKKYARGVKLLLKFGADPNVQDSLGQTPLFYVVYADRKSSLKVFKLLLLYGANLSVRNHKGQDVLAYAKNSGNPCGAQFLKNWQAGTIKFKKKKIK